MRVGGPVVARRLSSCNAAAAAPIGGDVASARNAAPLTSAGRQQKKNAGVPPDAEIAGEASTIARERCRNFRRLARLLPDDIESQNRPRNGRCANSAAVTRVYRERYRRNEITRTDENRSSAAAVAECRVRDQCRHVAGTGGRWFSTGCNHHRIGSEKVRQCPARLLKGSFRVHRFRLFPLTEGASPEQEAPVMLSVSADARRKREKDLSFPLFFGV